MFHICNNSKWSNDIEYFSVVCIVICTIWLSIQKSARQIVSCSPKVRTKQFYGFEMMRFFLICRSQNQKKESVIYFIRENFHKRSEFAYRIQSNGWLINFSTKIVNICQPHIKTFDMNLMGEFARWFFLHLFCNLCDWWEDPCFGALTKSSCIIMNTCLSTPHINISECSDIVIALPQQNYHQQNITVSTQCLALVLNRLIYTWKQIVCMPPCIQRIRNEYKLIGRWAVAGWWLKQTT